MAKLNRSAVVKLLQLEIKRCGGLRQFARDNDMSPGLLSSVIKGRCNPGPKILSVLKLREVRSVQSYYEKVSA